MADIYKVTTKTLNVRNKKGVGGKVISTLKKGREVTIYKKEAGENNKQWGNTKKKGNAWVAMEHLKKVSSGSSSSSSNGNNDLPDQENTEKIKEDGVYGNKDANYNTLLLRYLRAFGSPPKYTKEVDPWYDVEGQLGIGRAMGSTWYSNPSILSICPGTVDYLPGFSKKKKNEFFNQVKASVTDSALQKALKADKNMDQNGQLYAFNAAYADCSNVVNLLARSAADFMGVGDVNNIIGGTSLKLNSFDYGFIQNPAKARSGGVFALTKALVHTQVMDADYFHFFINHSGVSVSESFSTDSGKSVLEEMIQGSGSQLDQISRNINFLFGGAVNSGFEDDINKILEEARTSNELVGGIATVAKNYLKGGRLVFPKMITGMDYSKSISCELSFASPYGDRRSCFKYTILPCLYLLAMGSPKQLSSNMYTYPYLIRIHQPGNVSMDLAYISSLEFNRGGSDGTSWTNDGIPTEITARFTVTPLYTNMMVTSSRNPFLAFQNTALMEYLGNMCGIDMKMNILDRKVQLAKNLLNNYVWDTPTQFARGFSETKLARAARDFVNLVYKP